MSVSASYEVAVLAAARDPRLEHTPGAASTLPASEVDDPATYGGVDVSSAMVARVAFHAREFPLTRTCWMLLGTTSLTATYTVTVAGTAVVYNATSAAPANRDALLAGIAAAINADATVGPLFHAFACCLNDSSGANDAVGVRAHTVNTTNYGDGKPGFTFNAASTTSNVTPYGDAESFDATVYVRRSFPNSSSSTWYGQQRRRAQGWTAAEAATASGRAEFSVGVKGIAANANIASQSRVMCAVSNVLGVTGDGGSLVPTWLVTIAPGRSE